MVLWLSKITNGDFQLLSFGGVKNEGSQSNNSDFFGVKKLIIECVLRF